MNIIEKTLDVGCGDAKAQNAFGIDQFPLDNVDLVCDLNKNWPIESDKYDRVLFRHSISHLDSFGHALSEAARVAKKNGVIEIIAPHFSSDNAFTDTTSKFFLGFRSVNYYCTNTKSNYKYYSELKLFLLKRHIYFYHSSPNNWKQKTLNALFFPLEFLANLFPRFYEKFLCFIFRANEVVFELQKR